MTKIKFKIVLFTILFILILFSPLNVVAKDLLEDVNSDQILTVDKITTNDIEKPKEENWKKMVKISLTVLVVTIAIYYITNKETEENQRKRT